MVKLFECMEMFALSGLIAQLPKQILTDFLLCLI